MGTGVISWSQTAATNASADSAVNFAEGMAPSAVNDSARALMASVAKWRDDIAGAIVTTGTSTAYAVTSYQGEPALTAGYVIAFNPHATNGGASTLNVDSLGAKPLRSAPGVEIAAGVIIQGTPYLATYFTSNSGEWILQGGYGNPYGVPVGGMLPYVGSAAPNSSFALPYGQAISRTTYSTLFALCSTSFGSGDGSTTFNLPDLRGRIPVGLDNMGGTAASRITAAGSGITGTTVGATGGAETVTLTTNQVPKGIYTFNDPGHFHSIRQAGIMAPGSGTVDIASGGLSANGQSATTGITMTDNAGGNLHTNTQPSVIVPWLIRII